MDLPLSRGVLSSLVLAVVLISCQGPIGGGTNVALLYGVSDYGLALGKNNLKYPKADVEALAPLLSVASGGVFQVTARTDAQATRLAMQQDIESAGALMNADSLFLFYYGGHGEQGIVSEMGGPDEHAYILPRGSITATQVLSSEVVTEDDLRSWLSALPTKNIIVILDACFSGGFISGVGNDGVPQDTGAYYQALWKAYLAGQAPQSGTDLASWYQTLTSDQTSAVTSWTKALAAGSGFASDQAQLLTAAGALEESYDDTRFDFQHGVFTYFLLESRTKADFDGNGYVTVSEAYRYAFDGIQSRWNGVWGAVGASGFSTSPSVLFLPHLSQGPTDFVLFKK